LALTPIRWKSKSFLVKKETTYGVDPTPTAANAVLVTDVSLQPMEGEDVSRNLDLPYMGAQEMFATGLRAVLTASFELVGSGETGVAPGWSMLARTLGIAEVVTPDDDPGDGTVEYTPISSGHESAAIYVQIGPTRYVILGLAGTGELSFNANGIPVLKGTWTGLWTLPGDQAAPTGIDLSNFVDPQVATKANTPVFTIDAIPFVMRNFAMNLGNDVQGRFLVGDERVMIVERSETITATVQAVPMATFNPYAKASQSPKPRMPIVLEHGTVVGRKVKFEAPACTLNRPSGIDNQQGIVEWPLTFVPQPTEGNDQWIITLS
jgi:hypothetical protein